jgi:hypothetical protein
MLRESCIITSRGAKTMTVDKVELERERAHSASLMVDVELNEAGLIRGPGKFEGEPAYALFYYDRVMNGAQDDIVDGAHGERVDVFHLTDLDRSVFPDLGDAVTLRMWECDQGFVYIEVHTRADEDEIRNRVAEIEAHSATMRRSVARELRDLYPYLF